MSTNNNEESAALVVERNARDAMQLMPVDVGAFAKMTKRHNTQVIEIHDLEKYQPAPNRIREKPTFHEADSFSNYVNRFKNPDSLIFFDAPQALFTAVLDYAEAGTADQEEAARWGDHTARLQLEHSDEWKLWFGRNAKPYGQIGFGRFLEENLIDIVKPEAASLLEMVMNFEAHKSVSYREATRLQSGSTQFSYVEEEKPGLVEIPNLITIKIPVFLGQEPQLVDLRFRYKIEEQKLFLWYEFVRAERLIREAAARILNDIEGGTSIVVLLGKRT